MAQSPSRQQVWTRYWSTGAQHSCASSYSGPYGGQVASYWRRVLSAGLEDPKILDLCTGNGALPALMADTLHGLNWHCDAVDLATVSPAWWQALPETRRSQVQFHSGLAIENLPFKSTSFDLIVSQYGLEYADLPRALAEISRLLAPKGRVALLMHHQESRPVRLARIELTHLADLLAPDGFMSTAMAMRPLLLRAATAQGRAALNQDAEATALRDRFNSLLARLEEDMARSDCPDVIADTLGTVMPLLSRCGAEPDRAEWGMAEHRTALEDSRVRLQELCDVALDAAGAQSVCAQLAPVCPGLVPEELREGEYLMGWAIHVNR